VSARHPIIAVTGSSGAGTTSVVRTFEWIFNRERVKAAMVEGDAFHRYDRDAMNARMEAEARAGNRHFSHFGPEANLFAELEDLFATYGESGAGRVRTFRRDTGTFSAWGDLAPGSDLLFYDGLHGALVTDTVNVARHADLLIGVVPIINLEWIEKLHRDRGLGGSTEAVVDTILRRMPDYVNYICPQFSQTHVNFQRVPTVDTSNPFVARYVPSADESFVVIRFRDPKGIDFPYLLSMLHDAFMSRPNIIVVPGGKMELAMQIILTPLILKLMDARRRAVS
jgi:phosphoribulokinase